MSCRPLNTQLGYEPWLDASPAAVLSPDEVAASIESRWGRPGVLTDSGRDGIHLMCRQLDLQASDEVAFFTTRSNDFVSSHVSCTVFNYAKTSKIATANTKLLYVIHLFGEIYENLDEVYELSAKLGVPVMEDFAHSMFVRGEDWDHHLDRADFVLFSLPKALAVPRGGILLTGLPTPLRTYSEATAAFTGQIDRELAGVSRHRQRRLRNFQLLATALGGSSQAPLFEPAGEWPYAFPLSTTREEEVATYLRHKLPEVEVCTWNRRGIVSVPVHQEVTPAEVERIADALGSTCSLFP